MHTVVGREGREAAAEEEEEDREFAGAAHISFTCSCHQLYLQLWAEKVERAALALRISF